MKVKLKNPAIFRSQESGAVLSIENAKLDKVTIPKQLPRGVSEEVLVNDAQRAKTTMITIIVVQFFLQILLKGSMDSLWSLFLICQMVGNYQIFDVGIPANIEIFFTEFKSLVKFEILKPDPLIQIFYPEVTVQSMIEGSKKKLRLDSSLENNGIETDNLVVNTIQYIVIGCIFLLMIVTLLVILFCCPKFKIKALAKLIELKRRTFWNNIIRSITISYLDLCIMFCCWLKLARYDQMNGETVKSSTNFEIGLLGLFITGYPIFCSVVLLYYRGELGQESMRERIGKLYTDITLRRNRYTILYYPLFMARRMIFVLLPYLFPSNDPKHSANQLQFLSFLSSIYIMFYA